MTMLLTELANFSISRNLVRTPPIMICLDGMQNNNGFYYTKEPSPVSEGSSGGGGLI